MNDIKIVKMDDDCPMFGNFDEEYTVDSDCFYCEKMKECKKATEEKDLNL